ncbi:hypothetical protein [Streptomyces cucumeris]|uniref:hypothetical protein n=1 Tax=Streptomyces cucumeris TaxID=2962890 RepID=UPI003D75CC7B
MREKEQQNGTGHKSGKSGKDSEPVTLHIDTKGEPYPLKISGKEVPEGIQLSDHGVRFTVTAPSAAEPVDPSKVEGFHPLGG